MSKSFTLIDKNTDNFDQWLSLTNDLAEAFSTTMTVTANSTGEFTTGNGFVSGIFGANTIAVHGDIRGGNVESNSSLTVSSNLSVNGSLFTSNANVYFSSSNVYINASSFVVSSNNTGNTVVITGNSTATSLNVTANTLSFSGNASFSNVVNFGAVVNITSDLNIGTGELAMGPTSFYGVELTLSGTSTQTIDSFDATDYRGGKYVISMKDVANSVYQMTEILLLHDGASTVYTTEYATLRTGNYNLGTVSATVNSTVCSVKITPTVASLEVKLSKNVLEV